jgi:hypothetical protein
MPKGLSARQRMQRTLGIKRGRTIYAKCGVSVEPVIGQIKDRQRAGQFSMRGLGASRASGMCMPPCTRWGRRTWRLSSPG